MMIEKNCLACGGLIKVRLTDHKRGWGKFCDKACSAAYKCHQRPKDVNKRHTKFSSWAEERYNFFETHGWPTKAPSIELQIGQKVKVKHKLHSPSSCNKCACKTNGDRWCDTCRIEEEAVNALEEGWDGHKT